MRVSDIYFFRANDKQLNGKFLFVITPRQNIVGTTELKDNLFLRQAASRFFDRLFFLTFK